MGQGERILLTVSLLIALALLGTSTRSYRFRKSRIATMLIGGGWAAVFFGALIGPSGAQLVSDEILLRATPLITVGLGWIGLMVGLQARRDLFVLIPRRLWSLTVADTVVSIAVVAPLSLFVLRRWNTAAGGPEGFAWIAPAIGLLAACSIGWAMETRSLGSPNNNDETHLMTSIRGVGGLAAIIAVLIFGLVIKIYRRDSLSGVMFFDPEGAVIKFVVSVLLAAAIGVFGRFALRLAGRDRGELLAVFLGLVTIVAGVASDLAASPLFTAMLAGVVIANLEGPALRRFERFIFAAEHVVAIIFSLLAGVLLDPIIGTWGLALAVVVGGVRLLIKPPLFSAFSSQPSSTDAPSELPTRRRRITVATVRQSPMAIAMAMGFVLLEPSDFARKVLTVVLLAGLLSEFLPIAVALASKGSSSDSLEGGTV